MDGDLALVDLVLTNLGDLSGRLRQTDYMEALEQQLAALRTMEEGGSPLGSPVALSVPVFLSFTQKAATNTHKSFEQRREELSSLVTQVTL